MSRLIEVAGVSKAFRIPSVRRDTVRDRLLNIFERRRMETLQVLDGVDFTVDAGERLGIMGRNGCGKSTLLKILVGIYRADGGRVTVRAPVTPILELGVGWNPQLDAIDNIYLVGAGLCGRLPCSERHPGARRDLCGWRRRLQGALRRAL